MLYVSGYSFQELLVDLNIGETLKTFSSGRKTFTMRKLWKIINDRLLILSNKLMATLFFIELNIISNFPKRHTFVFHTAFTGEKKRFTFLLLFVLFLAKFETTLLFLYPRVN